MKLKVLALAMVMSFGLVGCNYDLVDTTFAFDRAIINLTNGEVITVNVKSWRDYEDGDRYKLLRMMVLHILSILLIAH